MDFSVYEASRFEQVPQPTAQAGKTQVEVFSWWTTGGEAAGPQELIEQYNGSQDEYEAFNSAVAGGAGSNAQAVLKTRMLGGDPPDTFPGAHGSRVD